MVDVQTFLEAFVICPSDLPVFLMKLLSGKEQNFWCLDHSSQVSDYLDFQIIGCQTKGILLYF
jgi:hypothetical protein